MAEVEGMRGSVVGDEVREVIRGGRRDGENLQTS